MNETRHHSRLAGVDKEVQDISPEGNMDWQEPESTFIEPQLTQYGKVKEVTGAGFSPGANNGGGFFGGFNP